MSSRSVALAAPLFVGFAWLGMLVCAHAYVAEYSSPIPQFDDCSIVSALATGTDVRPGWLWSQHNEHRILLPRLLILGLLHSTHDFRSLMYAQVYLLAAVSMALILVARRIRGRTSVSDAFFPFLFLHLGHYENLLNGIQLALVVPTVLCAFVAMLVIGGPPTPSRRSAAWIGACLVALPLTGGPGLLEVPLIAAWIGIAGICGLKAWGPERRRSAPALVAAAALPAIVIGLYFVGYHTPPWHTLRSSFVDTVSMTRRVIGMSVGIPGMPSDPIAGVLLPGLCLATLGLALSTARSHPEERWRLLGIAVCASSVLVMAAGIAWGRGSVPNGAAASPRYVTLVTPLPAALYLAWCRYGTGTVGRLVRAMFCIGMGALALGFASPAKRYGSDRLQATSRLARDVESGYTPNQLAERHWRDFGHTEQEFARTLMDLRGLGLAPYDDPSARGAPAKEIARTFSGWNVLPIATRSDQPIPRRRVDGIPVVLVHAPTEIVLEIPPEVHRLSGRFGVHPLASRAKGSRTAGLRFRVEGLLEPGGDTILFERVLDPVHAPRDAGFQEFAVDVPPGTRGRVVLRVENRSGDPSPVDWGFWTAIEFR